MFASDVLRASKNRWRSALTDSLSPYRMKGEYLASPMPTAKHWCRATIRISQESNGLSVLRCSLFSPRGPTSITDGSPVKPSRSSSRNTRRDANRNNPELRKLLRIVLTSRPVKLAARIVALRLRVNDAGFGKVREDLKWVLGIQMLDDFLDARIRLARLRRSRCVPTDAAVRRRSSFRNWGERPWRNRPASLFIRHGLDSLLRKGKRKGMGCLSSHLRM
jgi:hypothetical protein